MEYNFDEVISRRGTHSVKWDVEKDTEVLPMWIADMDFKAPPAVIEALQARVEHGVFGYTLTPPEFFEAITKWWMKRHNLEINKDWIVPVLGIVPALSAVIRSFGPAGNKIIVQSPVYNHFFTSIENCSCEAIDNKLIYSGGEYTIDFNDLEAKASDPEISLLLLCNPHNPAGRVWTRDELTKLAEICLRNNVFVISDEIHSDLIHQGKHTPFASLGTEHCNNSVTLSSPSKTFNLAGLQVGYLFAASAEFKKRFEMILNLQDTILLSPFAVSALIAAYNHGEEWLEALKAYLFENYLYLKEFCAGHLPAVKVVPLQATYLVWLDCSALGISSAQLSAMLLKEEKIWVISGAFYGAGGEGFLRINIACPRTLLIEALNRLKGLLKY